jgi:ABC-2 type transport system permease protein
VDRLIALLGLRAKLEVRGLSRARATLVGLILLIPGLLLMAGFGSAAAFIGLRHLAREQPSLLLPVISVLATVLGLFWVLSPLLAGVALTETHDVTRLLHFPIPRRTLVVSSLLSNLLQPTVLTGACVAVAAAVAVAHTPLALPFTLTGAALGLLFAVAAAQAAGLVFLGLARDRRWHDFALFLGVGIGFLLSLGPVLLLSGGARFLRPLGRALLTHDLCALSPFAWGPRAAAHAGRGEWGLFALLAGAQLAATVIVVSLSVLLLERIHRSEVISARGRVVRARARMILPGPLGALVEKDLRTGWRDPAIRAAFFMGLVGPMVLLVFLSQSTISRSGTSIFVLAIFVGLSPFGGNAFGLERRGLALLMSFPIARWKILLAKNAGTLLLRLPGVLMIVTAGVLMAPLHLLPATLSVVFVTLLLSAGADNYLSILLPIPVPPPGANPYAGASGSRGLGGALIGTAVLAAVAALAVPFALLAWLPQLLGSWMLALVTLPLTVIGGLAVYAMLVIGAERLLMAREPQLLERVLEQP